MEYSIKSAKKSRTRNQTRIRIRRGIACLTMCALMWYNSAFGAFAAQNQGNSAECRGGETEEDGKIPVEELWLAMPDEKAAVIGKNDQDGYYEAVDLLEAMYSYVLGFTQDQDTVLIWQESIDYSEVDIGTPGEYPVTVALKVAETEYEDGVLYSDRFRLPEELAEIVFPFYVTEGTELEMYLTAESEWYVTLSWAPCLGTEAEKVLYYVCGEGTTEEELPKIEEITEEEWLLCDEWFASNVWAGIQIDRDQLEQGVYYYFRAVLPDGTFGDVVLKDDKDNVSSFIYTGGNRDGGDLAEPIFPLPEPTPEPTPGPADVPSSEPTPGPADAPTQEPTPENIPQPTASTAANEPVNPSAAPVQVLAAAPDILIGPEVIGIEDEQQGADIHLSTEELETLKEAYGDEIPVSNDGLTAKLPAETLAAADEGEGIDIVLHEEKDGIVFEVSTGEKEIPLADGEAVIYGDKKEKAGVPVLPIAAVSVIAAGGLAALLLRRKK